MAGQDNTAERQKIAEWQGKAKAWTEKTGLRRDYAREAIGTASGRQVYAKGRKLGSKPNSNIDTTANKHDNKNNPPLNDNLMSYEETAKKIDAMSPQPKSTMRTQLEKMAEEGKIKELPIYAYKTIPSEAEIIAKLAGGDLTSGSCASLANAYIACKAGFDVTDYRGGTSAEFFSDNDYDITKFEGIEKYEDISQNDMAAGRRLIKKMEIGKEYKLVLGSHEAIVKRVNEKSWEYLELQDPNTSENGWQPLLPKTTFQERFGAEKHSHYAIAYIAKITSFGKNKEFIKLMKYVNTSKNEQAKGEEGHAK